MRSTMILKGKNELLSILLSNIERILKGYRNIKTLISVN